VRLASGCRLLLFLGVALQGCAGSAGLTPDETSQASAVTVYKAGDATPDKYQILDTVSATDCSGAPAGGRVWGNAGKAVESLRLKAAELGANALVNVSCSSAALTDNCWSAQKCTGDAIRIDSAQHPPATRQ
jgi:hypothetical protein